MMTKKSKTKILTIITSFFFYNCSNVQQNNTQTQKPNQISTESSKSDSIAVNKTSSSKTTSSLSATQNITDKKQTQAPSKIDASTLFISNLRVATFQNKKIINELVSYEADGRADYVSYKICPMDQKSDTCVENIYTMNKIILPYLLAGDVLISVKACIDPEKAKNSSISCGKPNEIVYNSRRRDSEIESIMLEKDRIMDGLKKLEEDFRSALENFTKEGYQCLKQDAAVQKNLESKIKFSEYILKAPFGWMWESAKSQANNAAGLVGLSGAMEEVGDGISKLFDEIGEFLGDQCNALGEEWCGILRTVKSFAGIMLEAFNPVHSIGTFSGAIHDLTANPDSLVKRNCHAEENFQVREDTITQYWNNQLRRLQEIKAELEAKGYL